MQRLEGFFVLLQLKLKHKPSLKLVRWQLMTVFLQRSSPIVRFWWTPFKVPLLCGLGAVMRRLPQSPRFCVVRIGSIFSS
ncbi:unnamed protein product [Linum tenue]|uniref:Uncharacterized protein n=1 Tax=Linum tenue TaxID=586396 RepID=A0AAV0PWT5_9ROSI|nr:unnamed protein product [Linum tenue]